MRKLVLFLFLFLVAACFSGLITLQKHGIEFFYLEEYFSVLQPERYDLATLVEGVDGDTVRVIIQASAETVRLIGVDTPETVHPTIPAEPFGRAASLFTKRLIKPDETVLLTYDWNDRDRYGRLLAYLWFKAEWQGKERWILHNVVLVLNGFGQVYTVFPFREDYMEIFQRAEEIARENGLGLWGSVPESEIVDMLEKGKYKPTTSISERPAVKIVSIQYRGPNEYVLIKNVGDVPVNLRGWKLYSEGGQWYTFPEVILQPGETVSVHSGPSASGPLVWTKRYVWNDRGDKASLYDANGRLVDEYRY